MMGQSWGLDELAAKKLSLLGVLALVATHRYREERAALAARRPELLLPFLGHFGRKAVTVA